MGFVQCHTRGEYGIILCRRAAPVQWYISLLGLIELLRHYIRACSQGTMLLARGSHEHRAGCWTIDQAQTRCGAPKPGNFFVAKGHILCHASRVGLLPLCPPFECSGYQATILYFVSNLRSSLPVSQATTSRWYRAIPIGPFCTRGLLCAIANSPSHVRCSCHGAPAVVTHRVGWSRV